MTLEQFRTKLAAFIRRNKIPPTYFGRKVFNDPAWVGRILAGREPKEKARIDALQAMKEWKR